LGVVRAQQLALVGEHESSRAVLLKQADGGLRPEQAIEQARVGVQLGGQCLRCLRRSFVKVIEYTQFCPGREYLAPPATKYEIHDLIGCGVHCPSPGYEDAIAAGKLEELRASGAPMNPYRFWSLK
jgi:hypothetical protein